MLFDDNLGFFGFAVPKNMKISSDSDLTSIADGFSKGNMFNNLYDPYKNYKYERVFANNKQEELLLEIMALSFAINEYSCLNRGVSEKNGIFAAARSWKSGRKYPKKGWKSSFSSLK